MCTLIWHLQHSQIEMGWGAIHRIFKKGKQSPKPFSSVSQKNSEETKPYKILSNYIKGWERGK